MTESTIKELRVLIVDDRNDIVEMLTAMLGASHGTTVVGEAGNGEEALQRALLLQPDVILIDQAMPVMDGLTAIPKLREALPAAVILLHTGYATPELQKLAVAAGANSMIAKGTTRAQLIDAIMNAPAWPPS